MIETIDNACNTDRTSSRNSQTETLKLLTSDMAVETMPFTEEKKVSMVDASCATRARSLLSIGTQYDVDQAPQTFYHGDIVNTSKFCTIEKKSNTTIMIDKATYATTERTNASTKAMTESKIKSLMLGCISTDLLSTCIDTDSTYKAE